MGTYLYLRLKNTDNKAVLAANESLARFIGEELETHNGVKFGKFISKEMLEEDARFMNEDREGLKQVPHWERPITVKMLIDNVFWNEVGLLCEKISGSDDGYKNFINIKIWAYTVGSDFVDFKNSENLNYDLQN